MSDDSGGSRGLKFLLWINHDGDSEDAQASSQRDDMSST
jgi:hypothetical protein